MTEGGHLSGVVEHDGDNGGIIVTVDDETEALKTKTEVARVEGNTFQALSTLAGAELAGDQAERGQNLHEDGRSRRLAESGRGVGATELVDDALVSGDVTTVGTERLGKSAHENVDAGGVDTVVVADSAATGSDSANAVSLINEEVELVLVLQCHDTGEIAHGALHRVQTFDGNQDLLPRAVSAGLALRNGLTKLALEIDDIVVLEG